MLQQHKIDRARLAFEYFNFNGYIYKNEKCKQSTEQLCFVSWKWKEPRKLKLMVDTYHGYFAPPYSLHRVHHQCQHGCTNQTHVGPAAVCANLAHYEIFSNMIFIWANRFLALFIWYDVTGGQILTNQGFYFWYERRLDILT